MGSFTKKHVALDGTLNITLTEDNFVAICASAKNEANVCCKCDLLNASIVERVSKTEFTEPSSTPHHTYNS
jgi:hypothetical protein